MKITKTQLRQMIKEEIKNTMSELSELRQIPTGGGKAMSCSDIRKEIEKYEKYVADAEAPGYDSTGDMEWWSYRSKIADLWARADKQNCANQTMEEDQK